jgi:hypothetical protein
MRVILAFKHSRRTSAGRYATAFRLQHLTPMAMDIEEVAAHVVDAAVKLHVRLGPGLLESVYARLPAAELERRGLRVDRQLQIPFEFDGLRKDCTASSTGTIQPPHLA